MFQLIKQEVSQDGSFYVDGEWEKIDPNGKYHVEAATWKGTGTHFSDIQSLILASPISEAIIWRAGRIAGICITENEGRWLYHRMPDGTMVGDLL